MTLPVTELTARATRSSASTAVWPAAIGDALSSVSAPALSAVATANTSGATLNGICTFSNQHASCATLVSGSGWRQNTVDAALLMRRGLVPVDAVSSETMPPPRLPASAQWLTSSTLSPCELRMPAPWLPPKYELVTAMWPGAWSSAVVVGSSGSDVSAKPSAPFAVQRTRSNT